MIRVAVLGATGHMGREVVRQIAASSDLTLAGAYSHADSAHLGRDAGSHAGISAVGCPITVLDAPVDADVVVDFALPAGTISALPFLDTVALVSGTTGLTEAQLQRVQQHPGPLLLAANFSTGVNVLLALVAQAARALPSADIEVVEAHHRRKVDAPSGTALALADAAATSRGVRLADVRTDGREGHTGPRPSESIGLHALRGGSIVGHHTVWFADSAERLQLTHEAESRDVFATGALRAARWIAGRPPGGYSMADVLGLRSP